MVIGTVPIEPSADLVLARLIIECMRRREDSYDHEAADAASAKAEKDKAENPGNIYAGMVDYASFYKMSTYTACAHAKELQTPVYLLIMTASNEAQQWAQETLARYGESHVDTGGVFAPKPMEGEWK